MKRTDTKRLLMLLYNRLFLSNQYSTFYNVIRLLCDQVIMLPGNGRYNTHHLLLLVKQ